MPAQTAELPRENAVYPEEQKEEAYKLYASGMKLIDVGPTLGIKASTIGKWSSRYKWRNRKIAELREAGFVPKGSPETGMTHKLTEIPADLTLGEAQERYEAAMRHEALLFAQELGQMSESQKLIHADKIEKRDKLARKALKLENEKPRSVLNLTLLASGTVARVQFDSDEPANEPLPLVRESGATPEASATVEPSESDG